MPKVHVNRIGIIPKKSQAGKWRLITDLSYLEGHSVNDATLSDLCTLQYIAVDQVAQAVIQLGRGAQLAKTDIKAEYRLMPVHPQDRVKLGFKCNDLLYVDSCLPFGLRSAPKLFNALADALEGCISRQGVTFVHHYLDDFVVAGPPDSDCCQQYLHLLQKNVDVLVFHSLMRKQRAQALSLHSYRHNSGHT